MELDLEFVSRVGLHHAPAGLKAEMLGLFDSPGEGVYLTESFFTVLLLNLVNGGVLTVKHGSKLPLENQILAVLVFDL